MYNNLKTWSFTIDNDKAIELVLFDKKGYYLYL